ncbi:MAG: glycosyl hydrolase family 28-related protein, partial [Actinomycetota bacterium]
MLIAVLAVSLTAGAARSVPAEREALSVAAFGADPARGGDDTKAVQAVFDAAAAQNRDVHLPAGHYQLSRAVVFRAHGRTIHGDGRDKTTIAGDTSAHDLLRLEKTRDVTVRDLRFEGSHLNTSDTANTGKAVECYASQRTRLSRIYAYG